MKTNIKKIVIGSLILSSSLVAQAQSSDGAIYSFGPSCASGGQFTAKALQASQDLIATIKTFQSDPNCTGLTAVLGAIVPVNAHLPSPIVPQLQSASDTSGSLSNSETPSEIQNKMTALSSVAISGDPEQSPFIARVQQAYTTSALANAVTRKSMNQRQFEIAEGKLVGFAKQAKSVAVSSNVLTQLANALPNLQSCLIGKPASDIGMVLSSVVELGDAAATTQAGPSPLLSSLVQSILKLVQSSNAASSVAHLKQAQFNQSLQCLLEVSAESYCSVIDMQRLVKNPIVNKTTPKVKPDPKETPDHRRVGSGTSIDPLTGYNILSIHLPNIYQWVQKVQFGAPARTDADAGFKNGAIQLDNAFLQKRNTLPTFIWSAEQIIRGGGQTDSSRKQALISAIAQITGLIDADQSPINFFYLTQNKFVLPFYLLDEANHVPPCVYGTDTAPCDPIGKLNTPGLFPRLDHFDDSYLAIVEARLDSLNNDATRKAELYYQSRVVPNMVSLAIQSLNNPTSYSVKDSFEFVAAYLIYLKDFLKKNGQDDDNITKILPSVEDAYYRFSLILQAYDRVDDLKEVTPQTSATNKAINDAYSNIVNTVYDTFQMSVQHDGYVVSTLNDLVSAEYRLRLKKGIGLGGKEREFLFSTSQSLLDTIKATQFTNKVDILSDLANANTINRANLEVIDSIFFDNFFYSLKILDQKIACKPVDQAAKNKLSRDQAYLDVHSGAVKEENPSIMSWLLGNMIRTRMAEYLHPERYPPEHTIAPSTETTCDSANGDYKRLKAIACMQSLAFPKRRARFSSAQSIDLPARPEKGICDDVVMMSDYWNDILPEKRAEFNNLNSTYSKILAPTQNQISKTNTEDARAQANDNAICAYRNFRRNNMVYWMTKDMDTRISDVSMKSIIADRKLRAPVIAPPPVVPPPAAAVVDPLKK